MANGRPVWTARWYFWDGGFVMMGRGPEETIVPLHTHHAIQVALGLDGPVGLRGVDGSWKVGEGLIAAADQPHEFNPNGSLLALIFVDPESGEGRWLHRSLRGPITEVGPPQLAHSLAAFRALWGDPKSALETAGIVHSSVQSLCAGPRPVRPLDSRIVQALDVIRRKERVRVSIEEVARSVFLSPSRFAHLFSDVVGLPFRRYIMWRRWSRAMLVVGRGGTLSTAAHACGFADAAHLTRATVQMFGFPPSLLMQGGEFYEIPAPFDLPAAAAG